MKNASLLIWLTQLGLSVALPPICTIFLAVWLKNTFDWGQWVVWAGIILGVICAVDGLRVSLKAMERLSRDKDNDQHSTVSFNDHD